MSLFGEYIKERLDKNIIENEDGFMTYVFQGESCYIEDVYVKPEKRKSGLGKQMMIEVEAKAKEAGCKVLTGSVRPSAKNSTDSMRILLSVGFSLLSSSVDAIFFWKEL